ncbi:hypothetical protein CLAVI_000581 [Candidatus Clavichlamydia salmonicola]|uniref:hypothetical protein n=1 Tax=Candidatus Clavichlamydia salmonicola TaxID=469812 RepID=UPI0018919D92|nr:hypothetical protein [Candidatus Clavichlamydia salmonicola]MBF5050958.1 hypothetical protein [Candidatus Clavichlamydia salmonicola]
MSSVMSLWGREFPNNLSTAVHNIKRNMKRVSKVSHFVMATILGAVGVALATQCSVCSDSEETTRSIDTSGTICLVGGILYGVAGVSVAMRAIVRKVIVVGLKVNEVNEDTENGERFIERAKADLYSELLPRGLAGITGAFYGGVILPYSILCTSHSSTCPLTNVVLGSVATGLYVMDAGVALLDLVCLDVDEQKKMKKMEKKWHALRKKGLKMLPISFISISSNSHGWRPCFSRDDMDGTIWTSQQLDEMMKKCYSLPPAVEGRQFESSAQRVGRALPPLPLEACSGISVKEVLDEEDSDLEEFSGFSSGPFIKEDVDSVSEVSLDLFCYECLLGDTHSTSEDSLGFSFHQGVLVDIDSSSGDDLGFSSHRGVLVDIDSSSEDS